MTKSEAVEHLRKRLDTLADGKTPRWTRKDGVAVTLLLEAYLPLQFVRPMAVHPVELHCAPAGNGGVRLRLNINHSENYVEKISGMSLTPMVTVTQELPKYTRSPEDDSLYPVPPPRPERTVIEATICGPAAAAALLELKASRLGCAIDPDDGSLTIKSTGKGIPW